MKYKFPDKLENGRDILKTYAEYMEEKFGRYLSDKEWGIAAGWVKRYKKEYSPEEIMLTIWGVFNTKDNVRSINYCSYFFDNLNKYKKMKESVNKESVYSDDEVKNMEVYDFEDTSEGVLDEFFD